MNREALLIAGLLREPGRVHDLAELERGDFADSERFDILEAARRVAASGSKVCPERVAIELQRRGEALPTQGPEALAELAARASGDLSEHMERVLDDSLRRRASAAVNAARLDLEEDPAGAVNRLVSSLLKASAPRGGRALALEGVALERAIIEAVRDREAAGLSLGFAGLDVHGVRAVPGRVVVLAASTSIGKSALASQFALNLAGDGARVLFASLEMSRAEVLRRMVQQTARIPSEFLEGVSDSRLKDAAQRVAGFGLGVADLCGDTRLETLTQTAQAFKARGGLDVLVVDYLGLLRLAGPRLSAYEAASTLSREIKQLAGRLDCGVVLLAQLSRRPSQREDSRPQLSDLRDSGAIEQDADAVLLIDRQRDSMNGALLIAKNRSGPVGNVEVLFDGPTCSFAEAAARPAPKARPAQEEIDL